MTVQTISREATLLRDYEQISKTVAVTRALLDDLTPKLNAIQSELERATRPPPKVASVIRGPAYFYNGKLVHTFHHIDAYLGLMRALWTDFPELRETMAKELRSHGWSRRYVSTERAELFTDKTPAWIARYSEPLVDGWFVDTNHSRKSLSRLARAAIRASGFTWGSDAALFV